MYIYSPIFASKYIFHETKWIFPSEILSELATCSYGIQRSKIQYRDDTRYNLYITILHV